MSPPVPFDPTELLHHREWVGRLARRLCRDEHAAEDSVQTVFAQALRRPPGHRNNLRAWLAQLLRHTLGMQRRASRRRDAREQRLVTLPRDAHAEAAADAVLRTEAHRRLVDLVLQLPEPQRGLVVRHYFEDAPVADLAAQSTLTADAVRAHLRRARERLRHELECSDARQRRAFALLTGAGGTGGATVAAAAIAGGLLMTTMLKIGCAALAAAAVLLWWSPWADVPIPITADAAADAPATTVTSSTVHDPAVRGAPAERHAQALPTPPAAMALTAELVGLVDGIRWQTPLVIRAKAKVDEGWQEHEALAVAEPTGAFSFELPGWAREAETLELRVSPRHSDPNYDCEGARFDREAVLVRKPLYVPVTVIAQLTGRVVDESGIGVPAARVCAYRAADALPSGSMLAHCNTDGAGYYTLRAPTEGDLALIALPMEPAQLSGMRLHLENGAILDGDKPRADLLPIGVLARSHFGRPDAAPDHRLPPASPVTVTIALPAGLPTEAARLSVKFPEMPRELNIQSMQRLVVWSLDRCAMVSAWPQLAPLEQTLRLPAGVRVQLRPMALHTAVLSCCVEPATEVVAPASCTLTVTGSPRTLVVLQGGVPLAGAPVRAVLDEMRYRAETDAQGRCQVLLGPTPVSITVQAFGIDPVTVTMGPQQSDPTFVDLPTAVTVPLSIATRGPLPVLAMTLEIRTRTGVEVLRIEHLHRTTPADPFVVDVPPGRYRIAMSAPKDNATRDAFLVPNWREVTVRAAGWTEDWTVEHGGRCRVEIQGPVDWLLGGPLLLERPGYDTVMLQYDTAVGSVLSPILSPGDYTLRQRGGLVVAEVHITALQTVTVQVRRP